MSILPDEIKVFRSNTVNDSISNGNRMDRDAEILDAVKNNLWPDIGEGERTVGSTKYRKQFFQIDNVDDLTYADAKAFVETFTPGEDIITFFPATQDDIQDDITGSERLYGSAQLANDANSGATTLVANTEGVTYDYFQDGDLVRISDKTSVSDGGNNSEYKRLAASSAISYSGDQVTLTLEGGESLDNSYLAADTKVASIYEFGDVTTSFDNKQISSASGTYSHGSYPLTLFNDGTIEQTFIFTFTDATNFDCVGDDVGSAGSGVIGSDFSPTNPDTGQPYFTILAAGWGGTWVASDTISFDTHPASIPLWQKRIVPAGSNSLSSNKAIIAVDGASA